MMATTDEEWQLTYAICFRTELAFFLILSLFFSEEFEYWFFGRVLFTSRFLRETVGECYNS